MAKTHGCTYFAGLWKEDLQIGLIWYVSGRVATIPKRLIALLTKTTSWSWISEWGKVVKFQKWESNHNQVEQEGVVFADGLGHDRNSGLNPFGTVTNKSLALTGRLKTAVVDQTDPDWQQIDGCDREDDHWVSNIRDPISGETIRQIALDSDPRREPVWLIYCLLCTVRQEWDKWQLTCLGLVLTNQLCEEFTRIGLVFIQQIDWYGKLENFGLDTDLGRGKLKDIRFIRKVRVV